MSDKEKAGFDWAGMTVRTAVRLRAPKVAPVDPAIVRQAQRSYDGVEENGETLHVLEHEFASEAMAAEFAKQMRRAGEHTSPMTSVSVAIDPEDEGNTKLVRWKAGERRGRRVT